MKGASLGSIVAAPGTTPRAENDGYITVRKKESVCNSTEFPSSTRSHWSICTEGNSLRKKGVRVCVKLGGNREAHWCSREPEIAAVWSVRIQFSADKRRGKCLYSITRPRCPERRKSHEVGGIVDATADKKTQCAKEEARLKGWKAKKAGN